MTRIAKTRQERREQVVRLLGADYTQSDRSIARGAGVSHVTVAVVRGELEAAGQIERRTDQDKADRQRANRNLTRTRQGEPGGALRHGAYSASTLAPRVEALTDELRRVVPGHTPADEAVTKMLALLLAQIEQVNAWVAERGLFKNVGRGELHPVLTTQRHWINSAARLADQLGLTPTSRSRLGIASAADPVRAAYAYVKRLQDGD